MIKRSIIVVSILFVLLGIPSLAMAGAVSVNVAPISAGTGEIVTVSGVADPNTWVTVKALNDSKDIIFLNSVRSDTVGNYHVNFSLPSTTTTGVIDIIAGYGNNVANGTLTVTASGDVATPPVPIVTPTVTVANDGSNKTLEITQDTINLGAPVSVTVPSSVTNATVNVGGLLNAPSAGTVTTSPLPALTISVGTSVSASPVQVSIPNGTCVSAPAGSNWDGTIHVPTVQSNSSVTVSPDPGKTSTVSFVIEVGLGDVPLIFNKAVRILIPGQAGKEVGYTRNGTCNKITNVLSNDSQTAGDALPNGGEGKIDVGSDLVVWTKHFTAFVIYTQTTISSSGGNRLIPQPVNSTTGDASVKPSAGGKVSLGSEASATIPAGALKGSKDIKVAVTRKDSPPASPSGSMILGQVFEFKLDGVSSYTFNQPVTLTFTFDPTKVPPGTTPVVYYYDNAKGQWMNIGGTVSGSNITVKVNHFTLFAVMAKKSEKEKIPAINLSDIANHWAKINTEKLVNMGAINGYPDGSFRPDSDITRAEITTALVKAFKLAPRQGKVFTDTAIHWARDSISTAAAYGIISGYDDSRFGPDDPVTREQMAVMIVKAAKLSPTSGKLSFTDSEDISTWANNSIVTAVKEEIIKGYSTNIFRPKGNATRAEAVTIIVNGCDK